MSHIGVVASNRIGNLIGAQSAIGARNAAHAIALISVIVGFAVMIIMLAARNVREQSSRTVCFTKQQIEFRLYLQ
jgi:hypothetical protein